MINKTIHYCWFGENNISDLGELCVKSWKKYCPDYKLIKWSEHNIDIETMPNYVKQAYALKKWAFVTDYIRLYVVYNYGGIYLDTDVELKKNLDTLLKRHSFFGIEKGSNLINTGIGFGAEAHASILKDLMDDYDNIDFATDKTSSAYDSTPCPERNLHVFEKYGFIKKDENQLIDNGSTLVLASEYLCPINWKSGEIVLTSNTISIHHFDASWLDEKSRKKIKIKKMLANKTGKVGLFLINVIKKLKSK